MGFIKLKNLSLPDQIKTGQAIVKLCNDVGLDTPISEWKKFKDDPKAWLYKAGYRYEGTGAGPNGEIPAALNIVPVYDTADTMYVRVPFKGRLDPQRPVENEDDYPMEPKNRFPVLLARYFMRQCRK